MYRHDMALKEANQVGHGPCQLHLSDRLVEGSARSNVLLLFSWNSE